MGTTNKRKARRNLPPLQFLLDDKVQQLGGPLRPVRKKKAKRGKTLTETLSDKLFDSVLPFFKSVPKSLEKAQREMENVGATKQQLDALKSETKLREKAKEISQQSLVSFEDTLEKLRDAGFYWDAERQIFTLKGTLKVDVPDAGNYYGKGASFATGATTMPLSPFENQPWVDETLNVKPSKLQARGVVQRKDQSPYGRRVEETKKPVVVVGKKLKRALKF
jgi:hypothetical protein